MVRKGLAVGVDIGGTNLRAAVVDSSGRIMHLLRAPSPIVDPARGQHALIEAIQAVTTEAGFKLADLEGVGIGIPGWMDRVTGSLIFAPKMAHWQGVFALDAIERELGMPVFIDSDPNVATLGELWMGAGREARDLVMITLGTGLGCGIVIDGKLYAGHHGMSGEFGHIIVEAAGDDPCDCGIVSCLETQVAGPAIARRGRQAVENGQQTLIRTLADGEANKVTTATVFAAAAQGDPVASGIVARAGELLGYGLATVVSLFEPQRVIVGGGMADVGELIFAPIRRAMAERCYLVSRGYVTMELVPAKLGDDAGVIGAAGMALGAF